MEENHLSNPTPIDQASQEEKPPNEPPFWKQVRTQIEKENEKQNAEKHTSPLNEEYLRKDPKVAEELERTPGGTSPELLKSYREMKQRQKMKAMYDKQRSSSRIATSLENLYLQDHIGDKIEIWPDKHLSFPKIEGILRVIDQENKVIGVEGEAHSEPQMHWVRLSSTSRKSITPRDKEIKDFEAKEWEEDQRRRKINKISSSQQTNEETA